MKNHSSNNIVLLEKLHDLGVTEFYLSCDCKGFILAAQPNLIRVFYFIE